MTNKDQNFPQNNPTSQKTDVFGTEALNRLFSTVMFPVTRLDLLRQFSNQKVEYIKGNPVKLEELINNCPNDKFTTRDELVTAISKILDRSTQEKSVSKKV